MEQAEQRPFCHSYGIPHGARHNFEIFTAMMRILNDSSEQNWRVEVSRLFFDLRVWFALRDFPQLFRKLRRDRPWAVKSSET